ncbi:MAG: hypothetical protein R2795_24210 [Saprospiraceae bacterium]
MNIPTRLAPILLMLFTILGTSHAQEAWQDKIDASVWAALQAGDRVEVIIMMNEQADLRQADHLRGKAAKSQYVFQQVSALAQRTQVDVKKMLTRSQCSFLFFRIVNALVAEVDRTLATRLAKRSDVRNLQPNPWSFFDAPMPDRTLQAGERGVIEWGVSRIRAHEVWGFAFSWRRCSCWRPRHGLRLGTPHYPTAIPRLEWQRSRPQLQLA